MRIKLDENIPVRVAPSLKSLGHDVETVRAEALSGCAGPEVWGVVQREQRFLITQDLDFSDTRRFAPGSHHGLLLLRLQWPTSVALIRRIENLFQTEKVSDWPGCFVVASDRKVRIRKPAAH